MILKNQTLPEPGTLWHTLFGTTDQRTLTSEGEYLSDDEFDTLRVHGQIHRIQEGSLAEGLPDVYEEAPATIQELQTWLEQSTEVLEYQLRCLPTILERGAVPVTELAAIEHEFERQQALAQTIQTRYAQLRHAISELQHTTHLDKKDLSYTRRLQALIDKKIEIGQTGFQTIKASFPFTQAILDGTTLLQLHQTVSDEWSYDALRDHVNALIDCRTTLKDHDSLPAGRQGSHPYVVLLGEAIKDTKYLLSEKDSRVVASAFVTGILPAVSHTAHMGGRQRTVNRRVKI